MDIARTSVEVHEIKQALEDLTKEELLEKCRSFLTIAEKAILAKNALKEEVNVLKINKDSPAMEIIESFSKQKLEFVSTIDKLQNDKTQLMASVDALKIDSALNNTETQTLKRQITRISDEIEQLLTHLGDLEKQNEYLNKIGLEQRDQLLALEQTKLHESPTNQNVEELQTMLRRSLDEIQTLTRENDNFKLIEKNTKQDLINSQQSVDVLQKQLLELKQSFLDKHNSEHKTQLEQTKKEIDAKTHELESVALVADDLNTELHKNRALVEVLRGEIKNTNTRLSDNQIISSGITSDLENANEKLKEKNKIYHGKIVKFAAELRKLKLDKDNILTAFKNYNSNVKTWKNELEKLSDYMCDELIKSNNASEHNRKLTAENDKLKSNLQEILNTLTTDALKQRENADLLNELNVMNEALKERDELIASLLKKQRQNDLDLNEMQRSIAEKDHIIATLQKGDDDAVITNVLVNDCLNDCDMANVKDLTTSDYISRDYIDCENMSDECRTISKAEDLGRFKDLDTSWEDRYSRLRSLALKQKARIRDLTSQLSDVESRNDHLNAKVNSGVQTMHALQVQCDTLQDKLDSVKVECGEYVVKLERIAVAVSRDKSTLAANDEVIGGLRCDVERMEKDRAKTELWKKQVSVKVQSLKKELEANDASKRDFEAKLADLGAKLEQKDRLLRDETSRHADAKNSLQEVSGELKKRAVITLEMQHYERAAIELNQRMEMRTDECNKWQEQVGVVNRTASAQRDQIQTLECQLAKLDDELTAARQELTDMQKKSCDLEAALSDKEISAVDSMVLYEEAKREIEDLNLQLSKVMAEQLKSLDSSRIEISALQLQVLGLEQHLTAVEESLRLRDMELADVKAEYDGYKVRAQSVLRQNQTCDTSMEEKLSEEADSLRSCMNIMRTECEELRNTLSELKISNDTLVMQKLLVDNKIVEMQRKVDIENEKYSVLSEKYDAVINEHSENIKILKAQSDTLISCYRAKLHELESRHNRDILQLQAHLDQSAHLHGAGEIAAHLPILGQARAPSAPPPMLREAAEGSDSLDYNIPTQQHPLEQLLRGDVSCVDVPSLRRQLVNNESRVTHLTDLLADTEQDLAKHIQMNVMLKEEIRRQRRSVEREKHAENLEYMKNIIVKFITLNNGDERQRLVPVLNTILKLSPDETQRINAIAKGEYKGWSDYLPTWNK